MLHLYKTDDGGKNYVLDMEFKGRLVPCFESCDQEDAPAQLLDAFGDDARCLDLPDTVDPPLTLTPEQAYDDGKYLSIRSLSTPEVPTIESLQQQVEQLQQQLHGLRAAIRTYTTATHLSPTLSMHTWNRVLSLVPGFHPGLEKMPPMTEYAHYTVEGNAAYTGLPAESLVALRKAFLAASEKDPRTTVYILTTQRTPLPDEVVEELLGLSQPAETKKE